MDDKPYCGGGGQYPGQLPLITKQQPGGAQGYGCGPRVETGWSPDAMPDKKQRQIQDNAHHRGGDGGQRRGKSHLIMGRFNKRPAGENKDKRG